MGKAEEVLPKQYEEDKVYADVIVVDPPRKGCDPVCLDTIVMMGPKKVVYVSCDSGYAGPGCEVFGGERVLGGESKLCGYVSGDWAR